MPGTYPCDGRQNDEAMEQGCADHDARKVTQGHQGLHFDLACHLKRDGKESNREGRDHPACHSINDQRDITDQERYFRV